METVEIQKFTGYQKFVVAMLAFLQFTVILDFMIMSPLGAAMMPALNITPAQFGLAVSVYAFSAGAAGLMAAGFADKYDRKKLLIFFYVGFVIGTLLCGLATDYHFLLFARLVTGLFGGVIGSIVFAITTDLFPMSMRGRVMGFVQTAFAASQILGLPAGLYLSNHWDWHAPFMMIVVVSTLVGILIVWKLRPIDAHLKLQVKQNPLTHLWKTLANPTYLFAFAAMALLSLGGFMLMPFGSAFTVHNLGIHIDQLPMIYLVTGIFSIMVGPAVGFMGDRFGKYPVFLFGSFFSIVMVVIYTNMGISPLWLVMLVNAMMFIGIFSRMIPTQALMSAVPDLASRGSFMSISASMQQVAGGFGAMLAGLVVLQRPDGYLEHFDTLGWILVGTSLFTVFMIHRLNNMVTAKASAGGASAGDAVLPSH